MAVKLNKTRRRDTAILVISCFIAIILSKQILGHNDFAYHHIIEFVGYFLTCSAAMGRVYCTAFLGGFKNRNIIDYGPFSICRNPLYFFSFVGVCGIALMSVNIFAIVVMPLGFLAIYIPLIKREEIYLKDRFGKEYLDYYHKTPRLLPNFKLYNTPKEVPMTPRTLLNSIKDSVMWFLAFPILEFIEYLQNAGYIKPVYYLNF